jgi:Trypsin-like peptidase domain
MRALGLSVFVFAFALGCVDSSEDDVDLDDEDLLGDGFGEASVCGTTDEAQYVNSYNGGLGVSINFVRAHKGKVGAIETTNSATAQKYCSGALVGADLFLTAGHCVNSSTVGDFVAFNYERVAGGTTLLTQRHVKITAVVEHRLGDLDYAILRLEGRPGDDFGVAAVSKVDAVVGTPITIISHPAGKPKQVEAGNVSARSTTYLKYNNVDTLAGSSGAAILNRDGAIIGVHTNGGCTANGGANSGLRISAIRAVSRIL